MLRISQGCYCLLCAILLVPEIQRIASEEVISDKVDLRSRSDEVLTKIKESMDTVMLGAREIESLSNFNYKVFFKDGGREQAKRDFDEFRLSSIHHFTLERNGHGRWGTIGDKMIVLENMKDVGRAQLIVKPRDRPEAGEYTYRILYRDGYYRPKGKFNAEE